MNPEGDSPSPQDEAAWAHRDREEGLREHFAVAFEEAIGVISLFDLARMFGVRVTEVNKWKRALGSWSSRQYNFPDVSKLAPYTLLLRTEYRARGYAPYEGDD
jgi:hypothetical protein